MARKFVSCKDLSYISDVNRELIQSYVGQEVIYYAVSEEHTVSHDLYREAISKVWFSPVRLNARVRYDNPGVDSTNFTLDSKYSLDVMFHNDELVDRNVKPREGDFIEFGQIVFEITAVTQPQLVFGQVNKKIMTKCTCVPSREGQMQIHGNTAQFVDNSHPVNARCCPQGDENTVSGASQTGYEQSFQYTVPSDGDSFTVTIPGPAMADSSYIVEVEFVYIPSDGYMAQPKPVNSGRTTKTFTLSFGGMVKAGTILDVFVRDR